MLVYVAHFCVFFRFFRHFCVFFRFFWHFGKSPRGTKARVAVVVQALQQLVRPNAQRACRVLNRRERLQDFPFPKATATKNKTRHTHTHILYEKEMAPESIQNTRHIPNKHNKKDEPRHTKRTSSITTHNNAFAIRNKTRTPTLTNPKELEQGPVIEPTTKT